MKEQNLEQIFNGGLSNLEADVNPNAWMNIQKGLQAPAPQISKGSSAARTGLANYGGLFLALAGVGIMAAIYFDTRKATSDADVALSAMASAKETSAPAVKQTQLPVIVTEVPKTTLDKTLSNVSSASKSSQENKQTSSKNSITENKNNFKETHNIVSAPLASIEKHPAAVSGINTVPSEPSPILKEEPSPSINPAVTSIDRLEKKQAPVVNEKEIAEQANNSSEDEYTEKIYLAGAFSPNGDGINDKFVPMGEDIESFVMTIYDSKGQEIFTSREDSEPWNGNLKNGEPAAPGIYTYIANVTDHSGKVHPRRGKVTLTR